MDAPLVELRVHGVSGTPPTELLDRDLVERVAGDAIAGFYRPRVPSQRTDSWPVGAPDPAVAGPPLEGYVWGGLTSGAPSRALWLLLLPFTLINVAPRMRPAERLRGGGLVRGWLVWSLCRLLALVITCVFIAAFAGIGDDLVGWQCDKQVCGRASPGWLMRPVIGLAAPQQLAVGSALPLLGLLVLWWLSSRSISRYEQAGPDVAPGSSWADPPDAVDVGLRSRWMWQNEAPVRRLRSLHLQVGLALSLWFVGGAMSGAWRGLSAAVLALVSLYAVVALCVPSFTGHRVVRAWRLAGLALWGVLLAAAVATYVELAVDPDAVRARSQGLPRFATTLLWLLFGELVLVLALFPIVVWSGRAVRRRATLGEPGPRGALGGTTAAVIALVAVFLASVFTAGIYLFTATELNTGSAKPRFREIAAVSKVFAVPDAIRAASWAFAVSVAMLLAFVLLVLLWAVPKWLGITPSTPPLVPGAFATDYPEADVPSRTRTVLRAMWLGRLVDLAGAPLAGLLLAGGLLSYTVAGVLFAAHVGDREVAAWFLGSRAVQGVGAYLVVLLLLAMVVLGALAFRIAPLRRSVGILWDLASFWPRLCHPLGAPCYAERTIPDLLTRVRWYTSSGVGVVLAGHSQGSVISSAVVLQLRTTSAVSLERVGLLTFGCVVRRLYARYFPAYFGPAALRDVRCALRTSRSEQRWRNLWRYTDYLGGPVCSGPPPLVVAPWLPGTDPVGPGGLVLDLHLVDPPYDKPPGDTVYSPALRHSSYWKVPQFQHAVVRVGALINEPRRPRPAPIPHHEGPADRARQG
jgi:hypothetical protein